MAKNSLKEKMKITEFPSIIQLETVYACNARCVMCPLSLDNYDESQVDRMARPRLIDENLFDKICQEIAPNVDKLRRVTIQLLGEPLIDVHLERRIRRLKELGVKEVFFSSNGSLFNEERSISILESGVDEVDFSVDGVTKDTFEKIRVGLSYEKVVENIKRFHNLRNKLNSNTKIRIRFTIQESNHNEIDNYYAFWKDILSPRDIIYSKYMHSFAGEKNFKDLYPKDWVNLDQLNQQGCSTLWQALVIQSDGTVISCSDDYSGKDIFGNINTQTIKEVWSGDKFNNFRRKHMEQGRNGVDKCKDCVAYAPVGKLKSINGEVIFG